MHLRRVFFFPDTFSENECFYLIDFLSGRDLELFPGRSERIYFDTD